MKFKILGPLEVHHVDRQLSCRGQKQRLLLATLLLNANRVVSSDALVEALWGERPPQTPDKALQMHVSTLRKLLESDVLVTRPPGYELKVGEGELDLTDFERAVGDARAAGGAGRPREAAGLLRQALDLWRGPPLADLSFEASLQDELARLEEARLAALEDRVEADLAIGRHADVIAELEGLAARHPLRERLRAQLMLALYRSGRQAEALEVYRVTRSALVEELGIEPGRALKDLESAILAQDPALEPERREGSAALVGRGRELSELQPLMDSALSGDAALILIGGEPGIGKSRLAEALGEHGRERGAFLAVGRCWEAGGAPPYWPWVQALRSYSRSTDAELVRSHLQHGGAGVATLVPELRASYPEYAERPDDGSPTARFRLFEAVGSFLRSAASSQPLVVGLDDLHAADAPSLLLLRFVAAELGDTAIAIVGCYRDTEVGPDLAEALPRLSREPMVHRVSLKGLAPADTARLLELSVGQEPSEQLVARVHAQTDGNPLFAGEVARLFASGGYPERDDELPLPEGVREVIRDRVRRQSEPCRQTLTLASAFGREFELETLERLTELEREQLFVSVEEAIDARLVGEVPGGAGRLRFSHMLIRDVLYEDLPVPRRLELHRDIGRLLEAAYGSNIEPRLAQLAHHYLEAGSSERAKAIEYASRAGDRAASQLGYEEAARHYASALRLAEAGVVGDAGQTGEFLLSLGEVLSRAGDGPAAKDAFSRAADVAERSGDADRLARAALGYGGRFIWARAASDSKLLPLLERALAAIGPADSPARVRLLTSLASATREDASHERRVALADEGVAMARRIGDPAPLAHALAGQWPAVSGAHNAETRMGTADELVALADRIGDREQAYLAHEYRLNTFWVLADRSGVEVELDTLESLAEELHQPAQHWHFTCVSAALALMEGRFERAESLIAEAAELGKRAQSWNAAVSQRMQLFVVARAQGRLAELEGLISRSVHEYPALIRFRCVLTHLHAELGREHETREAVDELLALDLAHEHLDEEWLFAMSLLPGPCAFLEDRRAAERLYEILLPFERLYTQAPAEALFGSMARGLGVLATTARRFDDAQRHFELAFETERRMGAAPWLAHAQHDMAAMLVARDGAGDRERARELAGEALETYRELGMQTWADRVAALS